MSSALLSSAPTPSVTSFSLDVVSHAVRELSNNTLNTFEAKSVAAQTTEAADPTSTADDPTASDAPATSEPAMSQVTASTADDSNPPPTSRAHATHTSRAVVAHASSTRYQEPATTSTADDYNDDDEESTSSYMPDDATTSEPSLPTTQTHALGYTQSSSDSSSSSTAAALTVSRQSSASSQPTLTDVNGNDASSPTASSSIVGPSQPAQPSTTPPHGVIIALSIFGVLVSLLVILFLWNKSRSRNRMASREDFVSAGGTNLSTMSGKGGGYTEIEKGSAKRTSFLGVGPPPPPALARYGSNDGHMSISAPFNPNTDYSYALSNDNVPPHSGGPSIIVSAPSVPKVNGWKSNEERVPSFVPIGQQQQYAGQNERRFDPRAPSGVSVYSSDAATAYGGYGHDDGGYDWSDGRIG